MKKQQKLKVRSNFLLIPFLLLSTVLTFRTFKKVNIQDLTIIGSELFSKDEIADNSSLNFPIPLILIETKYTEKELKKNLSLKKVSVIRQILPFGLKILIKTRNPIAYGEKIFEGKKILGFIDKDGFFIDEKHTDQKDFKKFSIKVSGWKENFKNTLSKILNSPYDEIEISPSVFDEEDVICLLRF